MKTLLNVLVAAGMFGCGGQDYVYAPDTTNAVAAGLPAARTAIPPEQPQGAVEVVSYGVTDLHPGAARVPALHVRMLVTNDGDDTPWRIDTNQQFVEIPGEGRSAPMYVNSDVQGLPNVSIARHERRVLDFYYPLPDTIRDDSRLPRFELQWQVDTASRAVADRTSFDREVRDVPSVAVGYDASWPYWAGYGPYWWYDPFYPQAVFIHARPFAFDHRAHVSVGRFGGHFRAGGGHVARGGGRR